MQLLKKANTKRAEEPSIRSRGAGQLSSGYARSERLRTEALGFLGSGNRLAIHPALDKEQGWGERGNCDGF